MPTCTPALFTCASMAPLTFSWQAVSQALPFATLPNSRLGATPRLPGKSYPTPYCSFACNVATAGKPVLHLYSRISRTAAVVIRPRVEERPPTDSRPLTDRPLTDRPLTDRPFADRPLIDRPLIDRPLADRPFAEKPFAD